MSENTQTALVIANPMPADVVVMTAETMHRVQVASTELVRLTEEARAAGGLNAETAPKATAYFKRAGALAKEIEEARKEVKRPALEFGRLIDAAAKEALAPLEAATKGVQSLLLTWQHEEDERVRRENEERRKAQERARQEAFDAGRRLAEQQRLDATNAENPSGAVAQQAYAMPEIAEVVIPEKAKAVTKAVATRRVAVVTVLDDKYIKRSVTGPDGTEYKLMVVDERALKAAMEAGLVVSQGGEGARLTYEDRIVSTGR